MKRLKPFVPAICYGILIAGDLFLYITTCGWQVKELLLVLSLSGASLIFGLLLPMRIRW